MTTITNETLEKIKSLASIWEDYSEHIDTKPNFWRSGSEYFYDWLEWFGGTMRLCDVYLTDGLALGYITLTDKFLPEIDKAWNVFELITANERGNPDDFPFPWYHEQFDFTEWHRPPAIITVGGN
jgi:hypothetical protein